MAGFTGSPTYEWATLLATILNPLTGQATTYVHNAATFCDKIKRFTIDAEVNTKVSTQQALEVIQQKLKKNDRKLKQRTQLSPTDLKDVCSISLGFTVFTFREKLYAPTEGLLMGQRYPLLSSTF